MAITMNLFYRGINGNARKFVEEMITSGTVDMIKAEEGNICYEYYSSISNPEEILLIDSQDNQDSIDKHHASPMMKTIIDLRNKYDLHMEAKRYISNDELPKDDIEFIRE